MTPLALKTKLRHTCAKYSQVKVPYKYRTVTNKDLAILKQDKGKGIVLLDTTVYIGKCLLIINIRAVPTVRYESVNEN